MVGTANDNKPSKTPGIKSLTIAEAADELRISRTKIDELIKAGELTSYKIGARRFVPADTLKEYIDKRIAAESES